MLIHVDSVKRGLDGFMITHHHQYLKKRNWFKDIKHPANEKDITVVFMTMGSDMEPYLLTQTYNLN